MCEIETHAGTATKGNALCIVLCIRLSQINRDLIICSPTRINYATLAIKSLAAWLYLSQKFSGLFWLAKQ